MKIIKEILEKIGETQARILISIIFVLFVPLMSLLIKKDIHSKNSLWFNWKIKNDSLKDLRKQY